MTLTVKSITKLASMTDPPEYHTIREVKISSTDELGNWNRRQEMVGWASFLLSLLTTCLKQTIVGAML
jgi:hypothetical protein